MYFQQLNFVPHFLCVFGQWWRFLQTFSVFGSTNFPKITYLAVCTLPNNESTWEIVHFWCTSNNWTWCIISWVLFQQWWRFLWEFSTLGAKMSPKHKSGSYTLPNNKIYWRWFIFDVFPMTEFYAFFPSSFENQFKLFLIFLPLRGNMAPITHTRPCCNYR